MHQDKPSIGLDHLTHMFASCIVRGDWRTNRDAAVLSDFGSDISDAADVDVAMLFRESEFRRKMFAHQVAVEQGHRTAPDFKKLRHQDIGDCGFARTRQSGEEDGYPLLCARRKAA